MQITNQLWSPIPVGTKLRWILPPDHMRLVELGWNPDVNVVVETTDEEELERIIK
jgi:hypothetical protein